MKKDIASTEMSNRFVVFVLVLFLVFPCAGSSYRSSVAASGSDNDSTLSQKVERPKVKKGMINIAGKEREFTFTLFDSSEIYFPLPFTTYVPQDVVTETASSGEGDAVRFIANFDGKRNDYATVHVYFYPKRTTESEARELFNFGRERGYLRDRPSATPRHYGWSLKEYDFVPSKENAIVGYTALGRHGGRFFTVALGYPEGQEQEFAPRGRRILEEFRWKDTGQGLM
jgi:hypothetical protein